MIDTLLKSVAHRQSLIPEDCTVFRVKTFPSFYLHPEFSGWLLELFSVVPPGSSDDRNSCRLE